ncbi:MAG: transcription termination/antitermination protein NusG [Thermoleophilia bacterium]|jgi:transcriptional antiterminator NusG|nr:transcription termination/antitermination protein NusG [Actinomycetota bacterium]MCL6092817.1 transcription termination/antitermination protein NusG [Actinomycetota bacterium]MDA8166219.1 transcription termination/antitermination protein NusG [Actinomycetota bacterium]
MSFNWYVINTYSGHENKVRLNLQQRIKSMSQEDAVKEIVVPTEQVVETKNGQKVQTEKRVFPGYVLVNMNMTDDSWALVKNTPGVTGFVGSANKPVPLSAQEVDRILHTSTVEKPKAVAQFSVGEMVRVMSGPLSDFNGEIAEISEDQSKLKVLVNIFGRETPVELSFDQVKKV